jgi:hypothetical protein
MRRLSTWVGMSRKHFSEPGCVSFGVVDEEPYITDAGVTLKYSTTASTAVRPSDSEEVL